MSDNLLVGLAKVPGVRFEVIDNSAGSFTHANIRITKGRGYDTIPSASVVSIALGYGSYGSTRDIEGPATVWDLVEASTTVEAWGGRFGTDGDPEGYVSIGRILDWAAGGDDQ